MRCRISSARLYQSVSTISSLLGAKTTSVGNVRHVAEARNPRHPKESSPSISPAHLLPDAGTGGAVALLDVGGGPPPGAGPPGPLAAPGMVLTMTPSFFLTSPVPPHPAKTRAEVRVNAERILTTILNPSLNFPRKPFGVWHRRRFTVIPGDYCSRLTC